MICPDCKKGGKLLNMGMPELAITAHENCPGLKRDKTACDCQHACDQSALNQEAIKRETEMATKDGEEEASG